MNKNSPFCLLSYFFSIFFFMCLNQWFLLWLVMELSTITFVGMYFYKKNKIEGIVLYFFIQSVASFFILFSLMMNEYGNLTNIPPSTLFWLGMCMKLGLTPFHNWLPSVTMSSNNMICYSIILFQKIVPFIWITTMMHPFPMFVILISLLNLLMMSPQNIQQETLKMILILSSMSHSSWLMLSTLKINLWEVYFVLYMAMMTMIFMILLSTCKKIFQNNARTPLFLIFLTLGGMPPFLGFFPKLMVSQEIMNFKSIMIFSVFILFSIWDLFIYSRLSILSLLLTKMMNKWKKNFQISKMLLMLNLMMLAVLWM